MTSLIHADAGARDETHALFGQVMWLVAGAAGLFALGSYLGRHLSGGFAFVFFILALACLIAMRFTTRSGSPGGSTVLLGGVGFSLGLAMAPTISYYAAANPRALWQASGATALFMVGAGAAGYATRRDLSGVGRASWWALLALIVFGVVMIFVNIPAGALIYSILGLVIFAGLTMFDFQRLRSSTELDSAPLIAASIFLDALNVFLFFLQLFGRNRD
jgi:FtsH-binding integral membrane protein